MNMARALWTFGGYSSVRLFCKDSEKSTQSMYQNDVGSNPRTSKGTVQFVNYTMTQIPTAFMGSSIELPEVSHQ